MGLDNRLDQMNPLSRKNSFQNKISRYSSDLNAYLNGCNTYKIHFKIRKDIICKQEQEDSKPLTLEKKYELKSDTELLRDSEKFMVVKSGEANCNICGYQYTPEKGDADYPISRGTYFENLPDDWTCPNCGAGKIEFKTKEKVVAGFAVNQQYGLGTNLMTSEQKSLLIYGALLVAFILFMSGYFLE